MKLITILTLLFFYSCAKNNFEIAGTYSNDKINKISNYLNGRHYSLGDSLVINKDSSFTYTNCSMKFTGNWKVNNDSLLLYFYEKTFHIDSLNFIDKFKFAKEIDSTKPYVFVIKNGHLIDNSKWSKGKNVITDLVKK